MTTAPARSSHEYTATQPDGASGKVRKSEWNAYHKLTGGGHGDILLRSTSDQYGGELLATVAIGSVLASQGIGTHPAWSSSPSLQSLTLATALGVPSGGLGLTSYTIGDILYASATNALSKLAAVADGSVLRSAGTGTAPLWGKVRLSGSPTDVTGTLPVTNGGTGLASYTIGDILYASGGTTLAALAAVAIGRVLTSAGVGTAPTWSDSPVIADLSATTKLSVKGANAETCNIKQATATINSSNGASTISATNLIPAGTMVIGVTTRVTTAFGTSNGLTSITIGDSDTASLWGSSVPITLGSTTTMANFATVNPKYYTAAKNVVITANGGTFDATGQIRVTLYYVDLTAPTS